MEELKELKADGNDPLFDKTNMLYKEFPSNFRQIRYFTLLIVQSAPLEIKEINLLEQQISEVIKNAVKHGNNCDLNKKVHILSVLHMLTLLLKTKEKDSRILKSGMSSTENVLTVCIIRTLKNLLTLFHSEQRNQMSRTVEMHCSLLSNIGTAALFTTTREMV